MSVTPNKVKVGIVGAGTVGQMHLEQLARLDTCEVVALADLRVELSRIAANQFRIPQIYPSHKELLEDPTIQAVVVVTKRHHTAPVVFDCLEAGKHVLSEKPMAKTVEQAQRLVDLANRKNLIYAVGYQRRHDVGTQIAKKVFGNLIQSGELGEVVQVRSWNFTGQDRVLNSYYVMTSEETPKEAKTWAPAPRWLPDQYHFAYDRFLNVFSHDTNLIRYFFGKNPNVRFADLSHPQGNVAIFDFGRYLATFTGGLSELNTWGERGEWDEGLEIFFEKGRLYLKVSPPLKHDLSTYVELSRGSSAAEVLHDGRNAEPAFFLQAKAFVDDIQVGGESLCSGLDSVEDLKLVEEIWHRYLSL